MTLVHGRLRYWVILLFVRHPAACGGWTLVEDFGVMEWGVMRAAIPLGCCVVGVAES